MQTIDTSNDTTRRCRTCGEVKDLKTGYYPVSGSKTGAYMTQCRACQNKASNDLTPEQELRKKRQTRRAKLLRTYGLTAQTFDALWESQAGKCALPSCDADMESKGWHIDHDHSTGVVRGILCMPHNVALGHFQDNVVLLQEAIAYLQKPQQERVVPEKATLCINGDGRPREPSRRICKECRAEAEAVRREETKARMRDVPCSVEGCTEPRKELPSQVLPYCEGHRKKTRRS